MQMKPFVSAGRSGMNDAAISSTTVPSSSTLGTQSSTFAGSPTVTRPRSLRKKNIMTGTVASAPSSTAQKIPGLPSMKMKSTKFIFAAPPSMIEVVSPTSVAAP